MMSLSISYVRWFTSTAGKFHSRVCLRNSCSTTEPRRHGVGRTMFGLSAPIVYHILAGVVTPSDKNSVTRSGSDRARRVFRRRAAGRPVPGR
jgi:hypothetical protein